MRSMHSVWLLLAAFLVASCMGSKASRMHADETADEEGAAKRATLSTEPPAAGKDARPAEPSDFHRDEAGEYKKTTEYEFSDDIVSHETPKPDKVKIDKEHRRMEPRRPRSAGVKAGSSDDNLGFAAFLDFLEKNAELGLPYDPSKRIIVSVHDQDGLPLPDAVLSIRDGDREVLQRRTYADGRALVFPSESPGLGSQSARLVVRYKNQKRDLLLNASRKHRIDLAFELKREAYQQVPLDIAFVLDTTGSMGDEIDQLKKTLEYINFQITHLTPRPDVRFGMVLFRDKGDSYRTRAIHFTADVDAFRRKLAEVKAGGGGDTPEDVQEGLRETMTTLKWREQGVKLAFLIGDAPPHLDYAQPFTYVHAMREAARKGIKVATIGASGLNLQGEVVWRQIAQYTMAPFVFLTYGETGDSEGSPSTVSHHVGSNWVAENLDAIIIRMVKVELAHYSPKGSQPLEDYFVASESPDMPPDDVLEDLFRQSVKQLVDYCVQKIDPATPTVVLPIKFAEKKLQVATQSLENRLSISLVRSGRFRLLEKKDLADVVKTLSDQFTAKYDSEKVAELGKLVPAKLAVFSSVGKGGGNQVEMMVKLVRLETGEILSLSLLKIERGLLVAQKR